MLTDVCFYFFSKFFSLFYLWSPNQELTVILMKMYLDISLFYMKK